MATISSESLKDLLTSEQAAESLGITVSFVGSLCRRGKFAGAVQVGGKRGPWVIPRASVTARKRQKTAKRLDKGGRPKL